MNVTDNRAITVELDGTDHALTIAEAQRLYDLLGAVAGVRRHGGVNVYPTYPTYPATPWWTNTPNYITCSSSTGRTARPLNTAIEATVPS